MVDKSWDIASMVSMSEGINVRLPGRLQEFVKEKSNPVNGAFSSASEYIRDLIRHDYEADQNRKWEALHLEVSEGMKASAEDFQLLEAGDIISEAKQKRASSHGA